MSSDTRQINAVEIAIAFVEKRERRMKSSEREMIVNDLQDVLTRLRAAHAKASEGNRP